MDTAKETSSEIVNLQSDVNILKFVECVSNSFLLVTTGHQTHAHLLGTLLAGAGCHTRTPWRRPVAESGRWRLGWKQM